MDDCLTYKASFGNAYSPEYRADLSYSLYTTEEFIKNDSLEIRMSDIAGSTALNSSENECVNITFSWDAEYLGMHIAITDIDLNVEYTIVSGEDGLFKFYEL